MMKHLRTPFVGSNDELLLGSHLLLALETGCMAMHAADFWSISTCASRSMAELSTQDVTRIRDAGPSSLQAIAENALHRRGVLDWALDKQSHLRAAEIWRAFRHRSAARSQS